MATNVVQPPLFNLQRFPGEGSATFPFSFFGNVEEKFPQAFRTQEQTRGLADFVPLQGSDPEDLRKSVFESLAIPLRQTRENLFRDTSERLSQSGLLTSRAPFTRGGALEIINEDFLRQIGLAGEQATAAEIQLRSTEAARETNFNESQANRILSENSRQLQFALSSGGREGGSSTSIDPVGILSALLGGSGGGGGGGGIGTLGSGTTAGTGILGTLQSIFSGGGFDKEGNFGILGDIGGLISGGLGGLLNSLPFSNAASAAGATAGLAGGTPLSGLIESGGSAFSGLLDKVDPGLLGDLGLDVPVGGEGAALPGGGGLIPPGLGILTGSGAGVTGGIASSLFGPLVGGGLAGGLVGAVPAIFEALFGGGPGTFPLGETVVPTDKTPSPDDVSTAVRLLQQQGLTPTSQNLVDLGNGKFGIRVFDQSGSTKVIPLVAVADDSLVRSKSVTDKDIRFVPGSPNEQVPGGIGSSFTSTIPGDFRADQVEILNRSNQDEGGFPIVTPRPGAPTIEQISQGAKPLPPLGLLTPSRTREQELVNIIKRFAPEDASSAEVEQIETLKLELRDLRGTLRR